MSEGTTEIKVEQPEIKSEQELNPILLKEELDRIKQTNERLLQESKEYKNKYSSLKTSIDGETKKKLEDEKDWKTLLEKERTSNSELSENLIKMKKQTLRKALDFEVAKYAKDAYDVEDVIASLDKESIKIDEDNLAILGVEEAVNALRTKKNYLFNSNKKPAMVDDRPGFNKPEKKPVDKLNIKESMATLKDLITDSYR
jgi:hypothetical protein